MAEHDSGIERARQLRKDMTPHERKLWYLFLQKYPVKIYKQKCFGPYYLDFYCAPAKLAIEIDGTQHYETEGREKDARRDEYLAEKGLLVLRFSNREIDREFPAVCEYIDRVIRERMGK